MRIVAVTGIAERQRDVGAVVAHRLHGLGRLGLDVRDGDPRMPLREVGEQPRHDRGRRGREADEPHAPGAQPPEFGEFAGRGIQRRRHGGSVAGKDPPGLGQPHPAADALDECEPEPRLERV